MKESDYKQLHFNTLPFFIGQLEHAPAGTLTTTPKRVSSYLIYWITNGQGTHFVDFNGYNLRPPLYSLLAPGQLQQWDISAPLVGFYITFAGELFERFGTPNFLKKLELASPFETGSRSYVVNETIRELKQLFHDLAAEFHYQSFRYEEAITSYLQVLLIQMQRQFTRSVHHQPAGAAARLSHDFLKLVRQQCVTNHHLSDYADQLGVNANYLSDTVKGVTGRPAGAWLRQQLVLEAKRLLVGTDLPAAKIAAQLSFNDPSYFGRFFKREAGETPIAFRARYR